MEEKQTKNLGNELKQWIYAIIIVAVLAFVLRTFVFTTVSVKGPSMEPLYVHGDLVVAEKVSTLFREPKEGDIVVCDYSTDEELIIKRVIGTPGDVIDLYYDGEKIVLEINGELIEEDYIKEDMQQPGDVDYPYTVPEGCYFVMGDNRNLSSDSRFMSIGAIPKENIEGRVIFKIWPLGD